MDKTGFWFKRDNLADNLKAAAHAPRATQVS
jgi:hypothetical protein